MSNPTHRSLEQPLVLIVEDDPGDAHLIRWRLLEEDASAFRICQADSLAAVRHLLEHEGIEPDVVLLDLGLPDSSGIETVEQCRQLTDAPLIVLTGLDDVEATREAIRGGAEDYLAKGEEGALLLRAIRYALLRHNRDADARLTAAVFTHTKEGIMITDAAGLMVYVNQAFSEITGYAREEVIGRTPRMLKSGRHSEAFYHDLWEALRKNGQWSGDLWNRHRSGRLYIQATTISAVRGIRNRVSHYVGLFSDITEHRNAEQRVRESEQRLRAIINAEPECIKILDPTARLVQMNPAGLLMIEADSLAQVVGLEAAKLVMEEQRQDFLAMHQQVLNGVATRMEYQICGLKGGRRWMETHAVPLEEGGQTLHLAVTRDITERKQNEEALRQAQLQAEEANRAKSDFLASMSHDLRTPLNAILGFAQVLEADPRLDGSQQQMASGIRNGGLHLLSLINDILDLARIESGRFLFSPEEWRSESFFRELEFLFRQQAEQQGLLFQVSGRERLPPVLYCDLKRLRQILNNLLNNAIKFTRHGQVTLHLDFSASSGLRLEVEDSGVGMSAEEVVQLFEPFRQVGNHAMHTQGSGLGLSITRRLVEAMGGKIDVTSEPGKGSCFRVELPVTQGQQTAAPDDVSRATVSGYQRIRGEGALRLLIVDDQEASRQVLRRLLEPLGFAISEAEDGVNALAQLTDTPPDLVLTDVRMAQLNGLELTRRLHALPGFAQLPVIAVSANAYAEDVASSREAGCVAHLAKPVQREELLEQLGRHLPLCWQQRTTQQASAPPAPDHVPLTTEQAKEFLHLTRTGNLSAIHRFAEALHRDGRYPTTAARIEALARSFDIGGLVQLAREFDQRDPQAE